MAPPTHHRRIDGQAAPSCEALQSRCLLSADPWGAFPRLIGQDLAASNYPNINGAGESIAIIDTGVDYNDPVLGGGFGPGHKVIAGFDFTAGTGDPLDGDGHGTGVASIAAGGGFTLNGAQYQGVAPGANIIALRVDDGTNNQALLDSRIEQALQWVIAHRGADQYNIVAVNLSIGDGEFSHPFSRQPYSDELATLADDGVFIGAASGNNGPQSPPAIEYPAADPNVYAIGSINSAGSISSFTERSGDLDLLAPGENVPTSYYDPDNGQPIVLAASGTSFASPFAVGAAALLKQVDPALLPADIIQILKESGTPVHDSATGLTFSRLNLNAAIADAYQRLVPPPPPTLTGTYNSIAYDSAGGIHIAYYDNINRDLKYVMRSADGTWSRVQIVDKGLNAGLYPSLAIDAKGLADIAYYDAAQKDLRYAHFNGKTFSVTRIDATAATGLYPSLAFDAAQRPVVSYYDAADGDLRIAWLNKTKWTVQTLDKAGKTGLYSSLALNPATQRFGVAYLDVGDEILRYAAQNAAGKWVVRSVASTKAGAAGISLAFDDSGRAALSYYDLAVGELKYARLESGKWTIQTVASGGVEGKTSRLLVDGSGNASIFYSDQSVDGLFLATPAGATWSSRQLASGGGAFVSAALGPGGKAAYVWRETSSGNLHQDVL